MYIDLRRHHEHNKSLSYAKELLSCFKYLADLLVPPRVVVAGEMSGRIRGRGKVVIKEKAIFTGTINAEALIVQGIVVGDIDAKKLIIKKDGQLYYNNVNHNSLRMSRNGTFSSILGIKEESNKQDNNLTVFLDRLLKQAEKFLTNCGKNESFLATENPREKDLPLKQDITTFVAVHATTPDQNEATFAHHDTTHTQESAQKERASVYPDMTPLQGDVSSTHQDIAPAQEEIVSAHSDTTPVQENTTLKPQDSSNNTPSQVTKIDNSHETKSNLILKKGGIYFINTY